MNFLLLGFYKLILSMEIKPKYNGTIHVVSSSGKVLHINSYAEKPFWNKEHNCWMYETSYGLGGTSFGYILEKHIVRLANKNEVS
jgi:hypothetical protein